MSTEKPTNESGFRSCLICSGPTWKANGGVDACRACAAFFKRTASKAAEYLCRQGSDNCIVANTVRFQCKRCRYLKCLRFGMRPPSGGDEAALAQMHLTTSKTAQQLSNSLIAPVEAGHWRTCEQPYLVKLQQSFRAMCKARREAEVETSGAFTTGNSTPAQRTPLTFNRCNRVYRTCATVLFDFIGAVYDEFPLTANEKWPVIGACLFNFITCEGCYNSVQEFPNDPNIVLVSSSYFIRTDQMNGFFVDSPGDEHRRLEAAQLMRGHYELILRAMRPLLKVAALDEIELVVLLSQ